MSETIPIRSRWWQSAIGMGLLGLALMVGGWKLSTWIPVATPHEREQAEKLADVRGMANERELRQRLDEIARDVQQRTPPYQLPGRLAILVGLVLFVAAGVRMYHTQVPIEPAPQLQEAETSEHRDQDGGRS
jgi:hypothetical protein